MDKSGVIFVEFSAFDSESEVFILPRDSTIKDLLEISKYNIKLRNQDLLEIPLISGDRVTLDRNGLLIRGRMDGFKLYALGLKLPLNSSSEEELAQIPGVGKKLAHDIVEKRGEIGGFKSYDDLLNVKGVGKSRIKLFKEYTYIDESGNVTEDRK